MAAKKRKQQKKSTKTSTSRAGAARAKVGTSAQSADSADAFSYPEGTLSILSVDGVDQEFRLAPGLREAIAEAVDAIKTMLRQGYAFFAADRDGAHARVQRFDERNHAYVISGSGGASLAIPITQARVVAVPRQVGG